MENITNEQKAAEIARKNFEIYNKQGAYGKCCALDAMQWKDEQHEKEKQNLIDEACKWLAVNDSYAIPTNVQVDRLREYLNNIKRKV